MKRELNNHLKMLKKSIDWWKEESYKTAFEVERVNKDFEDGLMTECEVLDKLEEISNKIDYLYRKGEYERKNLFKVIQHH